MGGNKRMERKAGVWCKVALVLAAVCVSCVEGAVIDVRDITRQAVQDSVRARVVRQVVIGGSFTAKCEGELTQTSYAKPTVGFAITVSCTSDAFSEIEPITVPVDITGVPATSKCDAEEYLTRIDCGSQVVVDVTVVADENGVQDVTFTDSYAWAGCRIEGEASCGDDYVILENDGTQVIPASTKHRIEVEFETASVKAAAAIVTSGKQRLDSLFSMAKEKAGIADDSVVLPGPLPARQSKPDKDGGDGKKKDTNNPMVMAVLMGSLGGYSVVQDYVDISAVAEEMRDVIAGAQTLQAETATPAPTPTPTEPPSPSSGTETPTPIPVTETASPTPVSTPTPSPNSNATPTPTATTSATPNPNATATPTPTATATPEPVCIDASWVAGNHAGFEVHEEATMAQVLCYGSLPCATSGHVVSHRGKLMTMAELCDEQSTHCTRSNMRVNGVQHRRSHLMPCDGNVCLTTLDARSSTVWKRAENELVYFLLQTGHSGVAERLTRVQLNAAGRK